MLRSRMGLLSKICVRLKYFLFFYYEFKTPIKWLWFVKFRLKFLVLLLLFLFFFFFVIGGLIQYNTIWLRRHFNRIIADNMQRNIFVDQTKAYIHTNICTYPPVKKRQEIKIWHRNIYVYTNYSNIYVYM